MQVSFNKPPLIELIAELRWDTNLMVIPGIVGTPAHPGAFGADTEELYMHFGAVASTAGYIRFERVVPLGFPVAPYQVVYRYRQAEGSDTSTLYQLGNGVFTVNALPPYKNWESFVPVIEQGVEFLRLTYARMDKEAPAISSAIVRYIDGFRGALLGDLSTRDFLADVLGFKIQFPDVLGDVCSDSGRIVPLLQVTLPVRPGQLQIAIADSIIENERAVVFDTSVVMQRIIPIDSKAVVDNLTEARDVIHQVFMGVSIKLREQMEPVEVGL